MSRAYEWLNLIDVSGPFLAEPVLRDTLPDGLDTLQKGVAPRLRSAYDEWREAVDDRDPRLDQLHAAWIDEVLTRVLDYDDSTLLRGDRLPENVSVDLPEHGTTLRADMVLVEPARPDTSLMFVMVTAPDTDLDASIRSDGFVSSPKERMTALLRGAGCPLGLVTNGEAWTLVHAPEGAVASHATWYARMFGLERDTLRAFASLLGIHRFTGPANERLPALFERSLQHQGDVTEALGDQVARAVEVLMRALDRADQDRNRELLKDVEPKTLYEAGLTLMMRLVVILSAEERDLLLLGDPIYDAHYAISSMRSQLIATDDNVLSTRQEAWSRLLAAFRLVYAGSDHPDLRLPALGGSLFDPDRFPFLEGRRRGSRWQDDPADPLPIDDRTVLLLLEAIQTFRGRTLSYKALDVEQIGHVYEGLLDQTAGRVDGVTLQLKGSSKAKTPLVSLADLERARASGTDALVKLLVEHTERSEAAIRTDLTTSPDKEDSGRLLTSCRGDVDLRDRSLPFVRLIVDDPWGMPLVHQAGAIVIVKGTDRRESGSHYTPKSLTEKIVEETLMPVVYRGPVEGVDRKDWELKSPAELLDLKVCDPAMGSGAFLVQVCRWLGDRLVESWAAEEAKGRAIDAEGVVHDASDSARDPLVANTEERTVEARRLIAERCLYGVDMNPLAVELAKLSLWLTTVAKGRPFGFLDHNLRHGDSLLGIDDLDQVIELNMTPRRSDQLRLFGRSIGKAVEDAMELRRELRAHPVRDIEDVKAMARLDAESRRKLELPILIADAFVGCVLAEKNGRALEDGLTTVASLADAAAGGRQDARDALIRMATRDLAKDEPHDRSRKPYHWPLEFPEVFGRENGGFDAFVGNPPFLGGKRITGLMGSIYRDWLVTSIAQGNKGSADFVAYFFLRSAELLRRQGCFGLLATKTIAEGDTRQVGLEAMIDKGFVIYAAYPNEKWPGAAAVVTSRVHIHKGPWHSEKILSSRPVKHISAFLTDRMEWSPKKLQANESIAFIGSVANGIGFVLEPDEVEQITKADPRNHEVIWPYLNGKDLNTEPTQEPNRFIINFWDWTKDRARTYPIPWEIVARKVKPAREKLKRKIYRDNWWQFAEKCPGLYHAIGRGSFFERHPSGWTETGEKPCAVICFARVTKYLVPVLARNEYVFSEQTVVLKLSSKANLSELSSIVFECWVQNQSSSVGVTMRFTPTDCFETFPFPESSGQTHGEELEKLGDELTRIRSEIMISGNYGLTELYNRFNNPTETGSKINDLRRLHMEIDNRFASAYGWNDLDLTRNFRDVFHLPENDRIRFTISEEARREILHRLAELNHERYQEEVEQGLHGDVTPEKKPKPSKPSKPSKPRRSAPEAQEPSLKLDLPEPPQPNAHDKKDAILNFLRSRPGRHGKVNIFSSVRMSSAEWSSSIDELISEGLVICEGTAPNETYTISERGKNG